MWVLNSERNIPHFQKGLLLLRLNYKYSKSLNSFVFPLTHKNVALHANHSIDCSGLCELCVIDYKLYCVNVVHTLEKLHLLEKVETLDCVSNIIMFGSH